MPDLSPRRDLAWVRNSPMGVLLALLVVSTFVVPPLLDYETSGRVVTDALITLILLTGVVAVLEHRRVSLALGLLVVVVVVARGLAVLAPDATRPLFRELATVAAMVMLAAAVGINVFGSKRALSDRILGAVVLYLLLGLMWAFAYVSISAADPAAFAGALSEPPTIFEWIYFSFTTLTTLGFGDITPVAKSVRSLAMLEGLVGQLYPAIIIARLVSLQDASR